MDDFFQAHRRMTTIRDFSQLPDVATDIVRLDYAKIDHVKAHVFGLGIGTDGLRRQNFGVFFNHDTSVKVPGFEPLSPLSELVFKAMDRAGYDFLRYQFGLKAERRFVAADNPTRHAHIDGTVLLGMHSEDVIEEAKVIRVNLADSFADAVIAGHVIRALCPPHFDAENFFAGVTGCVDQHFVGNDLVDCQRRFDPSEKDSFGVVLAAKRQALGRTINYTPHAPHRPLLHTAATIHSETFARAKTVSAGGQTRHNVILTIMP